MARPLLFLFALFSLLSIAYGTFSPRTVQRSFLGLLFSIKPSGIEAEERHKSAAEKVLTFDRGVCALLWCFTHTYVYESLNYAMLTLKFLLVVVSNWMHGQIR